MEHVNEVLSQLHKILKCKMALLADNNLYFYPYGENVSYEGQELPGYNALEIETLDNKSVFYIDKSAEISDEAVALALLNINNQLYGKCSLHDSIARLLSDSYNYSDIAAVNQLLSKGEELFLITLSGVDINSLEAELMEIIKNSVAAKHISVYQGNILALVEEQNIYEACGDLQKNILTELYVETVIAIGGRLEKPQQLSVLYNRCIEAALLKQSYNINQKLLDYQSMLLYRIIASIDQDIKDSIVDEIFNSRFTELLNSEMELTIEEMFKNNLNLTDTSARLYIHRNTLLYRIEKIHKQTGFDLRRFEDSMIFKLAWLMYKEKGI